MAAAEACGVCEEVFPEPKGMIQCNGCSNYYHGKCVGLETRGLHMKKAIWKCPACVENENEVMVQGGSGKTRARKRSRVENDEILSMNEVMKLLKDLIHSNKEINLKLDVLMDENKSLKEELQQWKETNTMKINQNVPTYANVTQKTAIKPNVLIVKPKNVTQNLTKTKEDLVTKVQPSELKTGISMGNKIRNGGIILNCAQNRKVEDIQTVLQNKMGEDYEVVKPALRRNRLKVHYVDEREHKNDDQTMISKIVEQNALIEDRAEVKIIHKSQIFNRSFNMVIEMDEISYKEIVKKAKLYIGWSSCKISNDYSIIRCFKCCKYGHIEKECKGDICCPLCGDQHQKDKCVSETRKCINCLTANENYNLKLNINHCVWSKECETLTRMIERQRNKFISTELNS